MKEEDILILKALEQKLESRLTQKLQIANTIPIDTEKDVDDLFKNVKKIMNWYFDKLNELYKKAIRLEQLDK